MSYKGYKKMSPRVGDLVEDEMCRILTVTHVFNDKTVIVWDGKPCPKWRAKQEAPGWHCATFRLKLLSRAEKNVKILCKL